MSSFTMVSRVIERDVRVLFSDSFLIGIMFANFAIDLFVTAATFSNLISNQYFIRIAPGSNFVTAMVAGFQSGRDVWREKYIKDLASYLFTLPVRRVQFALARVFGGVIRSLIVTLPGTLVIAYLYGILFSPLVVEAFAIVGLFSLGIVGLSIAVSAFASTIEVFATVRSVIQLYLSFLSTIFYDAVRFPDFLQPIVQSNPMTWAMQAFWAMSAQTASLVQPSGLSPAVTLVGPTTIFALLGIGCYLWYARL